ncbi:MAG: M48 family metallopeptidase, partial [Planctomycetes bacterium]|nr:M48 family metallopeptidase [Planctomycetota bacterium]
MAPRRRARKAIPADVREKVLRAIDAEIEPVRTTPLYKVGLFFVALAMLVLPVAYAGIIALCTWGVWWHATHHHTLLEGSRSFWMMCLYVLPIVFGPVMALFLIKPLFVRAAFHQKPQRLRRDAEPFLYEYVEHLCDAVGAPAPRSIRVDCQVNAAAGFRRGLLSLFTRDLTLIVGLPLVAGCSLRQFSGILAHEFGHFAQSGAMRMGYVVRVVNYWFARVVYERDRWDWWLEQASRRIGDLRIAVFFYLARGFVWLARRVMWCLMQLGHLISFFMSREQEFDADRHQARLVGSRQIGPTLRRTSELAVAHQKALYDLGRFYDEGRLADNLPALVSYNADKLPREIVRELAKQYRESETGL